jgi:hypothetical protein
MRLQDKKKRESTMLAHTHFPSFIQDRKEKKHTYMPCLLKRR